MSVLPSGYLNSLCEIKDYDGNILLRGYLNRITDDDEFQIVRGGSKPLPTVMENKTLDVEVLNNIYGNALFVGKVAVSTKNHLKLSEVQAKKDFEKISVLTPFSPQTPIWARALLKQSRTLFITQTQPQSSNI